jgi:hypothetical protein
MFFLELKVKHPKHQHCKLIFWLHLSQACLINSFLLSYFKGTDNEKMVFSADWDDQDAEGEGKALPVQACIGPEGSRSCTRANELEWAACYRLLLWTQTLRG